MESPYKRRKTSPISPGTAREKITPRRPASHDGDPIRGKRALFMSPTKASLARFNPNLLHANDRIISWEQGKEDSYGFVNPHKKSESNGNGHQDAPTAQADETTPTLILNIDIPDLSSSQIRSPQIATQTLKISNGARSHLAEDARASLPEVANDRYGDAHQHQVENDGLGVDHDAPMSYLPGIYGGTVAATNQHAPSTPTRPAPTAIIPGMGLGEDGEPSLPSTPVHLGLEKPSEPPKGLFSDQRIKRPRRKDLASPKPSPLKENEISSAAEVPPGPQPLRPALGSRLYIAKTPEPPLDLQESDVMSAKERLSRLEERLQHLEDDLLRQLLNSDWAGPHDKAIKKIPKIPNMEKEVISSSAQVVRLRGEVRQLELIHGNRKDVTYRRTINQVIRHTVPSESWRADHPRTILIHPSLSHRIARFLPLSAPLKTTKPPSPVEAVALNSLDLGALDDDVPPFTISTSGTQLLDASPKDNILQRQTISLLVPSALFSTNILATVNTTSQTVTDLEVLQLSSWAENEFGSWLRGTLNGFDVAYVGTALRNYLRACRDRLKCWINTAQSFSDLLLEDSDFHGLSLPVKDDDCSQFASVLGRQECSIGRDAITLNISWQVSTGVDGKVKSDVSVRPAFPQSWQKTAIAAGLTKIGEAFDILKAERGVFEAISVVVRLMFPTEDGSVRNS